MGNYRQHLTLSSAVGVLYAAGTFALAGLHWVYGVVAAFLAAMSGLLPDLDHPLGVEVRGLTSTLGMISALAIWRRMSVDHPEVTFEVHICIVVCVYYGIRHGAKQILGRVMVHRGISHSFPTCAVWGSLAYLYYPSENQLVRMTMAAAVMAGFLSHLILDECFSVDIANHRVNRAFGTAMKFWAPSIWSTLAIYSLLGLLIWKVIEGWPNEPLAEIVAAKPGEPRWPWTLPDSWSSVFARRWSRFDAGSSTLR